MEKIPRRSYKCLLGEGLLYREYKPDYYWSVGQPYIYNPNVGGCMWCKETDKCKADTPRPTLIKREDKDG